MFLLSFFSLFSLLPTTMTTPTSATHIKLVAPPDGLGKAAPILWLRQRLWRNHLDVVPATLDHLSLWELDVPCHCHISNTNDDTDTDTLDLWHTTHFATSFQYTTPSGNLIDPTDDLMHYARQCGLQAFGAHTTYAGMEAFVTVIADAEVPTHRITQHLRDLDDSRFPRGPWALPCYRDEPICVA